MATENNYVVLYSSPSTALYTAKLPAKINGKKIEQLKVDDVLQYIKDKLKSLRGDVLNAAELMQVLSAPELVLRPMDRMRATDHLTPDTEIKKYLVQEEEDGRKYTQLEILISAQKIGGLGGGGREVPYNKPKKK